MATDLGNLAGSGGALFDPTDAYSVSNLYKQVYTDLVRLQIQQYDSLLSDTLMQESIEGEVKSFDKYLKHDVSKLKTRERFGEWGSDEKYGATDSERRLIEPQWFEYAELFDPRDEVGLLKAIAPDGMYLANALSKSVLVQTRTGNGITVNTTTGYGTATTGSFKVAASTFNIDAYDAYEGLEIGCKLAKTNAASKKDTTPLVTFTTGASGTVALGGEAALTRAGDAAAQAAEAETDIGASVTEFNIEKLIRARQKLDANNALMPGMPYICVLHPNQFYSLMADMKVNLSSRVQHLYSWDSSSV